MTVPKAMRFSDWNNKFVLYFRKYKIILRDHSKCTVSSRGEAVCCKRICSTYFASEEAILKIRFFVCSRPIGMVPFELILRSFLMFTIRFVMKSWLMMNIYCPHSHLLTVIANQHTSTTFYYQPRDKSFSNLIYLEA